MTTFLRRHARDIKNGVLHLWWVFVIVMPLNTFGTWLAIDHANANTQRSLQHSNQQFQRAKVIADRKAQEAIRISIAQSAYAQNKSACGWRTVIGPTALKDKRLPLAQRKKIKVFLDSQVTVPSDFKCASLPKKPPKASA